MEWDDLISAARDGDTKQRLSAVPSLQEYAESHALKREEVTALMSAVEVLLKDNNFKVTQGTLQLLRAALAVDPTHFKPHLNEFLPQTVDKLSDAKPSVREAASQALATICQAAPLGQVLEKIDWAWSHKNHRVPEELANVLRVAFQDLGMGAIGSVCEKQLAGRIVKLLENPTQSTRDAALKLLAEWYYQSGNHTLQLLQQFDIRPSQRREIDDIFSDIDPIQDSVQRTCSGEAKADKESSKATSRPSSAKPVVSKRGGFGDSGVLNTDDLATEPIFLMSEGELKSKFAEVAKELDVKNDWEARIKALLVIGGMATGNGPEYPSFTLELKEVKDAIAVQLSDRRSAVARVACQILGQLAIALGNRFESLAVYFFPTMLKISGITGVQVIVDAAIEAMETVFTYCRAKGALPVILNTTLKDKSKILRTNCANLLLLVLEVWEKKSYDKYIGDVEKVIISAAQDAQADVRNYGKMCYGAFSVAWPERVSGFLKGLSMSVREKMLQAGAEYVRQHPEGSLGTPQPAPTPPRPGTAPARRLSDVSQAPPLKSARGLPEAQPSGRNTVAGGALRINKPASEDYEEDSSSGRRGSFAMAGPAARIPSTQQRPPTAGKSRPSIAAKRIPARETASNRMEIDDDTMSIGSIGAATSVGGSMSLASILNRIKSAKSATDWERRRDALYDLRDWVAENGSAATNELCRLMDSLVPIIVDSTKDAHHQIVVAALEAWGETAKHSSRAQEPYIERLMSSAFLRAVDPKAVIRAAALNALRAVSRAFGADTLLVSLNKCMNSSKSTKGKIAVLEFSIESLGAGSPAGVPSGGHPCTSMWLESVSKLLQDKSTEVRQCATSALEHMYKNMDTRAVIAFIVSSPGNEQTALKRALSKGVPGLSDDILAFERDGGCSLIGVGSTISATDRAKLVNQIGKERRLSGESHSKPVNSASEEYGHTRSSPSVEVVVYQDHDDKAMHDIAPAAPLMLVETGARHVEHSRTHHGFVADAGVGAGERRGAGNSRPATPTTALANISNVHLHSNREQGDETEKHQMENSHRPWEIRSPAPTIASGGAGLTMPYSPSAYTSRTPRSTPGEMTPRLDPAAIPALLTRLVGQLTPLAPNMKTLPAKETLHGIQTVSKQVPDTNTAWAPLFFQAAGGLLELLEAESADPEYQEEVAETLKLVCFNQTRLLVPYLETVLPRLLGCRQSATGLVKSSVDMCIEQLVTDGDPRKGLELLCLRLRESTAASSEKTDEAPPEVLSGILRSIGNAARVLGASELDGFVPKMLDGLVRSFDSRFLDVRKEVVRCFICLWWSLGDSLTPSLAALSDSQRKVVTVYIEKNRMHRSRNPDAPPTMKL